MHSPVKAFPTKVSLGDIDGVLSLGSGFWVWNGPSNFGVALDPAVPVLLDGIQSICPQ